MNQDHPVIDIGLHTSESKGCGCLGLLVALGISGASITHIVSVEPETQNQQTAIRSEISEEPLSQKNDPQSTNPQLNRWSDGIEKVKDQVERLEPHSQQVREQGEKIKAQVEKLEPYSRQIKEQSRKLKVQVKKLEPHAQKIKGQTKKIQAQAVNFGSVLHEKALSISKQVTGENTLSKQLALQSSCNASASEPQALYTVIGDAQALTLIQENYCRDAFINIAGDSQVASFNSRSDAEEFASTLTLLTAYEFRVSAY